MRISRDSASFELWLPHLRSNDAFVFDHRMFYNELIIARISATNPDFWFPGMNGVMRLDYVVYVIKPGLDDTANLLSIPMSYAIKHFFNIINEWGLFFTILKGANYIDRTHYKSTVQPPKIFMTSNRKDTLVPLDVPPGWLEMR